MHETHVFDSGHVAAGRRRTGHVGGTHTLRSDRGQQPTWIVERAVDEALRRKLVRLDDSLHVADRLEAEDRRRCTVMREILDAAYPVTTPVRATRNDASPICWCVPVCPSPTMQHRFEIGGQRYRIDLCYPEPSIVIEFDVGSSTQDDGRSMTIEHARTDSCCSGSSSCISRRSRAIRRSSTRCGAALRRASRG